MFDLRLSDLHEIYYHLCYGNEHPDQIACGEAIWYFLIEKIHDLSKGDRPLLNKLRFMDAEILLDPRLSFDEIRIITKAHCDDTRYNAILRIPMAEPCTPTDSPKST